MIIISSFMESGLPQSRRSEAKFRFDYLSLPLMNLIALGSRKRKFYGSWRGVCELSVRARFTTCSTVANHRSFIFETEQTFKFDSPEKALSTVPDSGGQS